MRICNAIIADTIASIPYQLGWFSKQPQELREEVAQDSDWSFQDNDAELNLSAYFLLWLLTVIQLQDHLTKGQRTWVKGRLTYISNKLGLKTAATMSQVWNNPIHSFNAFVILELDLPFCFLNS